MNIRMIIAGALSGLLAAILVDLDAWKRGAFDEQPFDWRVAIRRYVYGVISGVAAGLGIGGVAE